MTPKRRPFSLPAWSVGCEGLSRPALEFNTWFLAVFAEYSWRPFLEVWELRRARHAGITHAAVAWHGWSTPVKASLSVWDGAEWVDGSSACGWAGGALSIVQLSLLITTLTDQCWRQQEPKWHFSTLITHVSFVPQLFSASPQLKQLLRVRLDSFGLTDEEQTLCYVPISFW